MTVAKILIVEDEGIVALDIKRRLSQIGYATVGQASTGADAVQMALTLQPDVILMDVQLRGAMDGIEAAEHIRQRQDIPVIYLTAYANEQTLERAKSTEPYGYLTKPFEERELYTTVEIALYKHRMERIVRQQAQQLNQVLQSVPEGMILLNPDRRILMANTAASEHLKYLTSAGPGDVLENLGNCRIDELNLSEAAPHWQEIDVETDSGRRNFEVGIRPTVAREHCPDDLESGWVVVTRDVTQLHEIRRRAKQQERMAAVGQLAAGVAHDFNNILAAINMATEMVQMTQKDMLPANHRRLEMVLQQSQRASGLIRQIMDFSRRSVSERKSVNLLSLLHELQEVLKHTLPETISIEIVHDDADYVLDVDSNQIMQALMNLSLNARDAMPAGGTLTFTLDRCLFDRPSVPMPEMEDGHWISVRVSDTGVGIKDDVLPHIFEPFFSTKGPDKGTGLGLAQVYGIVQQHDGFIDVTSREEHGTHFTIYLPDRKTMEPEQDLSEPGVEVTQNGLGRTILLVEDNEMLRAAMADALDISGYKVLEAGNGVEALELLERHHDEVKLVITDLIMPGMGGSELSQEINRRYHYIEMIMMTGYSPEEEILHLKATGVTHWLQKPIPFDTLVQTIEKLLEPVPAQ